MSPRRPRRARRALLLLLAATAIACTRTETDWLEAAGDADPFVRALGVTALGQARWDAPEDVVAVLLEALRDPDPEVGQRAADALMARADQALPHTLGRLAHPDLPIREALAALVGTLGDDAVAPLSAALSAPEPEGAALLVSLLAQLGEAGRPAVLEATRHADARVRRAAVDALATADGDDDEVLQRMLDLVTDEAPPVRGRAARTAVRALVGRLARTGDARAEAERLLAALGPVALREASVLLDDGPPALRPIAAAWLRAQGPGALPGALAAVHRGTTDVDMPRLGAIAVRARLFGGEAVPVLVAELAGDDPARLVAAAAACAALGREARDAIPALVARLDHASEDVRVAAATALAHAGPLDGPTEQALILAPGGDLDGRVARAVRMAIAAGTLETALEEGDTALAALRLVGFAESGEEGLEDLSLLALDDGLRARAAEALAAVRALPEDASLCAEPSEDG